MRIFTLIQSNSSQRGTIGKFPLPPPVGSISVSSYTKYIPSSSNDHRNRYMQSSSSGYGDEFQYALSPYAEQSSHDRVGFCFLDTVTQLFNGEVVNISYRLIAFFDNILSERNISIMP